MSICGRCNLPLNGADGFVLYQEPGGRALRSDNRVTVHGECIADEVSDGRLVRVSPFAFEPAPAPEAIQ